MSKKKNPKPLFVYIEDCKAIHEKIDAALWGFDGRGGIVKDIGDIKSDLKIVKENLKARLGGKDKAAIIVALVTAIGAIIVALLKT